MSTQTEKLESELLAATTRNILLEKENLTWRELNNVRQCKLIVLREMHATNKKFRLQNYVTTPIVQSFCQEREPEKVATFVRTWIFDYDKLQIQNCNITARVTWATLHGLGAAWAIKTGSWLEDGFSMHINVNEWFNLQKTWRNVDGDTAMFVRFIDATRYDNDGHSVVVYRFEGKWWTIQAYYNVTDVVVTEGDVFKDDSSLVTKLCQHTPVGSCDFNLPEGSYNGTYEYCHFMIQRI